MIHDSTAEAEQQHTHLRVGSVGWHHDAWQNSFYPEDLPEDWRLSYYANEFSAVLIPAGYLQREDCDFEQWYEDVPEGFRFFLEWPGQTADTALLEQCALLHNKLAGLVLSTGMPPVAGVDCYYTSQAADASQCIWQPGIVATSGVAMFPVAGLDLRQQKALLQDFVDQQLVAGRNLRAVILSDEYVPVEALRAFKALVELMAL